MESPIQMLQLCCEASHVILGGKGVLHAKTLQNLSVQGFGQVEHDVGVDEDSINRIFQLDEKFLHVMRQVKVKQCMSDEDLLETLYKFTNSRYEKLLPVTVMFSNGVDAMLVYLPSDHPKSRKSIVFEPCAGKEGKNVVTRFTSVRAVSAHIAQKLLQGAEVVFAFILKKRSAAVKAHLEDAVNAQKSHIAGIEAKLNLLKEREKLKHMEQAKKTKNNSKASLVSKEQDENVGDSTNENFSGGSRRSPREVLAKTSPTETVPKTSPNMMMAMARESRSPVTDQKPSPTAREAKSPAMNKKTLLTAREAKSPAMNQNTLLSPMRETMATLGTPNDVTPPKLTDSPEKIAKRTIGSKDNASSLRRELDSANFSGVAEMFSSQSPVLESHDEDDEFEVRFRPNDRPVARAFPFADISSSPPGTPAELDRSESKSGESTSSKMQQEDDIDEDEFALGDDEDEEEAEDQQWKRFVGESKQERNTSSFKLELEKEQRKIERIMEERLREQRQYQERIIAEREATMEEMGDRAEIDAMLFEKLHTKQSHNRNSWEEKTGDNSSKQNEDEEEAQFLPDDEDEFMLKQDDDDEEKHAEEQRRNQVEQESLERVRKQREEDEYLRQQEQKRLALQEKERQESLRKQLEDEQLKRRQEQEEKERQRKKKEERIRKQQEEEEERIRKQQEEQEEKERQRMERERLERIRKQEEELKRRAQILKQRQEEEEERLERIRIKQREEEEAELKRLVKIKEEEAELKRLAKMKEEEAELKRLAKMKEEEEAELKRLAKMKEEEAELKRRAKIKEEEKVKRKADLLRQQQEQERQEKMRRMEAMEALRKQEEERLQDDEDGSETEDGHEVLVETEGKHGYYDDDEDDYQLALREQEDFKLDTELSDQDWFQDDFEMQEQLQLEQGPCNSPEAAECLSRLRQFRQNLLQKREASHESELARRRALAASVFSELDESIDFEGQEESPKPPPEQWAVPTKKSQESKFVDGEPVASRSPSPPPQQRRKPVKMEFSMSSLQSPVEDEEAIVDQPQTGSDVDSPHRKPVSMEFFIGDDEAEVQRRKKRFEQLRAKKLSEDRTRKIKRDQEMAEHEKELKVSLDHEKMMKPLSSRSSLDSYQSSSNNKPLNSSRIPKTARASLWGGGSKSATAFRKEEVRVPKSHEPVGTSFGFAEEKKPRKKLYEETPPEIEPAIRITTKSNLKVVVNAITHVCLAGSHHMQRRENVLRGLQEKADSGLPEFDNAQYIILFRNEVALKFRGVYIAVPGTGEMKKIQGAKSLPQMIDPTMIDNFYKYNTGQKRFTKISTKSLTKTTDAVALNPKYFQK